MVARGVLVGLGVLVGAGAGVNVGYGVWVGGGVYVGNGVKVGGGVAVGAGAFVAGIVWTALAASEPSDDGADTGTASVAQPTASRTTTNMTVSLATGLSNIVVQLSIGGSTPPRSVRLVLD